MEMRRQKAREGDFIETVDKMIFDVKGLIHPHDRVIAYVRYVQDPRGPRFKDGMKYRKIYSLKDREEFLKKENPKYLFYDSVFGQRLEGVAQKDIHLHYKPEIMMEKLLSKDYQVQLNNEEKKVKEFAQYLKQASRIPFNKIGLSGSILVGLQTKESDIDLIVYGLKNGIIVHQTLSRLLEEKEGLISRYNLDDLKRLYSIRSKDTRMPLEDFLRLEERKTFQGKFRDKDFFIRFVIDWNDLDEKYGDNRYISVGYSKISAEVQNASHSIYTPSKYEISRTMILEGKRNLDAPIEEIVSFRGRFCQQALDGEKVIARGKLEKVIEKNRDHYYRIILGANVNDYMSAFS